MQNCQHYVNDENRENLPLISKEGRPSEPKSNHILNGHHKFSTIWRQPTKLLLSNAREWIWPGCDSLTQLGVHSQRCTKVDEHRWKRWWLRLSINDVACESSITSGYANSNEHDRIEYLQ
jgi:hypothetical protein